MEVCTGAHHWARLFAASGHIVRLIAPKFVVPYRLSGKRCKNDAALARVRADGPCCAPGQLAGGVCVAAVCRLQAGRNTPIAPWSLYAATALAGICPAGRRRQPSDGRITPTLAWPVYADP